MLGAADAVGRRRAERPFLPRAFSVLRAPARPDELQFLLEDVGPGTDRLCELEAGDELLLVGPLGAASHRPRDGRTPLLVGGGVGIAPLAIWQDQLGRRSRPSLLGFRDAAHADGAAAAARAPGRDRRRQRRPPRPRHRAARATELEQRRRTSRSTPAGRPPMLEAVRRDLRRARRPGPARARVGDGLRLRRLLRLRRSDARRLPAAVRRRSGARRGRSSTSALVAGAGH